MHASLEAVSHCEKLAETRWGRYITAIETRALRTALRLAGPPDLALEIGCEAGRWSRMAAEAGWQLICTDVNAETLALCQNRIPAATCVLVRTTDETLPAETDSISLLLCIEVPPVIQSDWFLREAKRVVKTGGILLGVYHNGRSLRGCFYRLRSRIQKRGGYPYYQFSYPAWRPRFLATGFELLFEEGCCWFPLTRQSNSGLVPLFTRLEAKLGLRHWINLSPLVVFVAKKTGHPGSAGGAARQG